MVEISNILKTRDDKNAVSIDVSIESKDTLLISADSESIILTSDNDRTVAKYADELLRSVHALYGEPIIRCKYDSYGLADFKMYTANIYIEERANI